MKLATFLSFVKNWVHPIASLVLLIIMFSTKGFLTITTLLPFLCTPHEVPLKSGVISVYGRVQYDHTLGRAWSADGSAVYASVRNRPKTDAV